MAHAIRNIFISHIYEDDSGLDTMKELWLYPKCYLQPLNRTVLVLPPKSNLLHNSFLQSLGESPTIL